MPPSSHSDSHYQITPDEARAARAERRRARHRPPSDVAPRKATRRRIRRNAKIGWGAVCNSLILMGSLVLSLFFLTIGSLVLADYRWIQAQVEEKDQQLAALEKQRAIGRRRLAILNSPAGQEQLLLEHGYLPPGDRFLLFPTSPEEQRAAAIPKNDVAPHRPSLQADDTQTSTWQRAGRTFGQWWDRFSAEDSSTPPHKQ